MKPLREQFINKLKMRGLAGRTIANYVDIVSRLTRHYMRNPLDLTAGQIEAYRYFLLNVKKLAPATINLNMECLRTFFNLMKPENTPAATTFSRMKVPKHLPTVLSRSEAEKLIAVTTNLKHKAVIMLLYCSGLRLNECINLKPVHIESARMMVRVEQGKGGKDRYTLLSQRTLQTLRDYCRVYKPKEWLFEGRGDNTVFVAVSSEHSTQSQSESQARQGDLSAYPAAQFCHASDGSRNRAADHSEASRTCESENYGDLSPCLQCRY